MLSKMDSRRLEKRSGKRTSMVVGLKIPRPQSHDPGLVVHTLDISSSGAKVGALREWIQPGSVLIVQRAHTRIRCLVVWSREIAPREIQIGIKFLSQDFRVWGLDLDDDCAGV
jgi:hypothetical protein